MAYQVRSWDDVSDTTGTDIANHGMERGLSWTQLSGTQENTSGAVIGSSGAAFALNTTPLGDKQKAQITVKNTASEAGVGCRWSWDGANLTGYYAVTKATPNTGYDLLKFTGSGFSTSNLDTSSSTSSAVDDVLAIEANGTTINVYKNGSLEITATDSSYASGGAGIGCDGTEALNAFRAYDDVATPSGIYLVNAHWQGLGVNAGTTSAFDSTGCDFMAVVVGDYSGGGTDALSDSESNTWTGRTAQTNGGSRVKIYDCFAPTTDAAHTITMTGTGVYVSVAVLCFANVDSFDQESGSGSAQPGSLTPSEDNCLLLAGLAADGTNPLSNKVDSSFWLGGQKALWADNWAGVAAAYQIQTSATARNPTFSGGSGNRATAMVVYTSSGGGGGGSALGLLKRRLRHVPHQHLRRGPYQPGMSY